MCNPYFMQLTGHLCEISRSGKAPAYQHIQKQQTEPESRQHWIVNNCSSSIIFPVSNRQVLFHTSESVLPGPSYILRPTRAHYFINPTYLLSNSPPNFYLRLTTLISISKRVRHRKILMYTTKIHAEKKNQNSIF